MKFDIGTILYIVITIIAVIASVAGKKKKPQVQGNEGSGNEEPKGFFDRIEDQFGSFIEDQKSSVQQVNEVDEFDDEPDELYLQEAASENNFTKDEVDEEYKTETSGYSNFEGLFNTKMAANADLIQKEAEKSTTNSEIIDVIDLDNIENPDYFEIVKDFDLGTAVIYSTIINRKEY